MSPGWSLYDAFEEFSRLGIGSSVTAWRVSSVNREYGICETYPRAIATPRTVSDRMLMGAAKFRSKGRIPMLSYLHRANMGCITRCSQPLAGLVGGMQKRSGDDEELVRAIFAAADEERARRGMPTGSVNLIMDARPRANAYANAAMGKGFESTDYYVNCTREFLGIDNIHVMRDSLEKLIDGMNKCRHY